MRNSGYVAPVWTLEEAKLRLRHPHAFLMVESQENGLFRRLLNASNVYVNAVPEYLFIVDY